MNFEEMYNFISSWSKSDQRKMIECWIEFFGLNDDIRQLIDVLDLNVFWV